MWLDGYFENGHWIWSSTKQIISLNKKETFLPWSDDDTPTNFSCLNLDRWEHNVPKVYGTRCSAHQPYVCEIGELLTFSLTIFLFSFYFLSLYS